MLAWVLIYIEIMFIDLPLATIIITIMSCRQYEVNFMNLMRRLLGITKQWGDEEPVTLGLTLFNNECNLPPFCPVLVRTSMLKQNEGRRGSAIDVINIFPTFKGHNAGNRTTLYSESIIEIDPKLVIENRPLISANKFSYRKLDDVIKAVKTDGAVTYIAEDLDVAKDIITDIGNFQKYFKYSAWLGHHGGNSKPEESEEKMVALMSIYDLALTIPIYSNKKVDGIAVHICLMWERMSAKSSQLRYADEMFFAMNQYRDNLLVVDGQNTYKQGFVGSDYIHHFREVIGRESRREAEVQKRAKMSKKKEPKSADVEKKISMKDLKPVKFYDTEASPTISTSYANEYTYYTTTTS